MQTGPPVPEPLLVPLLDAAGDVLRTLDADSVPPPLRPLLGFDRRGLARGAARQQLRRTIEADDSFRHRAVEEFLGRRAVATALEAWSPSGAARCVDEAAERSDLPLLASALWAARPDGWEFGLGVAVAAHERLRREQEDLDDARAREMQLLALEEAARRADDARSRVADELARAEGDLRAERASRREREAQARRDAERGERRAQDAEERAERAQAAATAAQTRAERGAERVRELERELRELRRQIQQLEAGGGAAAAALRPVDVDDLSEAAERARSLAIRLDKVVGHARRHLPPPDTPSRAPAQAGAARAGARARPTIPAGMRADTPEGFEAMLRTQDLALVVDGYNVSMQAWSSSTAADQRERLVAALGGLHSRTRCAITVVFDGADVVAVAPAHRPGVRVLFSPAGEEADKVVVREVEQLPPEVPTVVVSSDRWVQEHATTAGAQVASARLLLSVLR